MSSPLSHEQKGLLCRFAREAYDAWSGREAFEDSNPELSASKCFEAWRRVEQGHATAGLQSLTLCTQDHFLPIRAHFKKLLGNGAGALRDHLRAAEEPRIRARWKLQEALDARGLNEAYAATICQKQFRCALGDASAKQLWCLFYTVSKRRAKTATSATGKRRYVTSQLGTLGVTPGNPF